MVRAKKLGAEDFIKIRAIQPGMIADIQLRVGDEVIRTRTDFIGRDGNRGLLLRVPEEILTLLSSNAPKIGEEMVVRYLLEDSDGEVIAFQSAIVSTIRQPIAFFYIQIPNSIQLHCLRSSRRAATRIPAKIYDEENARFILDGIVVDMSWTGCRIALKTDDPRNKQYVGQKATLRFDAGAKSMASLPIEIMNFKADEIRGYFGLKFIAEGDNIEQVINELMIAL